MSHLSATGFDVDELSSKPVAQQLQEALAKEKMRVIDLFREWDVNDDSKVSRAEFHKAMARLKFDAPASDIDALFSEWDP